MALSFGHNEPKKPTNLPINSDLLEKVRAHKINLSATTNTKIHIKTVVTDLKGFRPVIIAYLDMLITGIQGIAYPGVKDISLTTLSLVFSNQS